MHDGRIQKKYDPGAIHGQGEFDTAIVPAMLER